MFAAVMDLGAYGSLFFQNIATSNQLQALASYYSEGPELIIEETNINGWVDRQDLLGSSQVKHL
jgi:hypothetical protein